MSSLDDIARRISERSRTPLTSRRKGNSIYWMIGLFLGIIILIIIIYLLTRSGTQESKKPGLLDQLNETKHSSPLISIPTNIKYIDTDTGKPVSPDEVARGDFKPI